MSTFVIVVRKTGAAGCGMPGGGSCDTGCAECRAASQRGGSTRQVERPVGNGRFSCGNRAFGSLGTQLPFHSSKKRYAYENPPPVAFLATVCLLAGTLFLTGCNSEYDDSNLRREVDDLKNRITQLESRISTINSDLAKLDTLVSGLDTGTTVIGVDETEEGYRLRFSDGSSILIKHGTPGQTGEEGRPGQDAPTIGVRADTDGIYYWTLTTDGVTDWLVDDDGNRMRVTGSDAATPVMGVDDEGYWTVSYDGGATFVRITDADGNPVQASPERTGDGIFTGVTQDEYYVYLTLADGTQIALPKSAARLDITFSQSERIVCEPGQSLRIAYTVTGGDAQTVVECLGKEGWSAEIERTDAATGFVVVTAPASKRNGRVLVFASSAGHTVMKTLTFGEGILTGIADTYKIDANGGPITVRVTTDLEYTVSIPDYAQSWLSAAVTRAELRTETLTFTVAPNATGAERSATVALAGASGTVLQTVAIVQLAEVDTPAGNIVFADKTVKAACVAAYDTDGDGELSYEEAAAVGDLSALKLPAGITSFDEFQYFTGISEIPYQQFWNMSSMRSIVLPTGVTSIDDRAFHSCSRLSNIVLPAGLTSIGKQAFNDCI